LLRVTPLHISTGRRLQTIEGTPVKLCDKIPDFPVKFKDHSDSLYLHRLDETNDDSGRKMLSST
jgi:hypothetical protein